MQSATKLTTYKVRN